GFTDAPRTATVVARSDVSALRVDRDNLMNLAAEFPSIGIEIIGELGQRLHSTNQSLAYLTYAANALARDEYDAAMLVELTNQSGALASFARAFADMAAEIRAKQNRREEMQAAAAIQQSILPGPLSRDGADQPYRIAETVLTPGDALLLFSDGITEAFSPAGEIFGEARLERVLDAARGRAAAELVAEVIGATDEFAAGAEQSDDITCLALAYRG